MIIKDLYPLISCICMTDNRPAFLLKAIIYFDYQSYPNRELVISYPENDTASKGLIENIKQLSAIPMVTIERDGNISLGTARNEAVTKCNGEYICTWDDDDWYSNVRLMQQYSSLFSSKRKASIITDVILYDHKKKNVCLSGIYNSKPYHWAGTLLCFKEIVLQNPYRDIDIGEDEPLMSYLVSGNRVQLLDNYNLYAFIYHGGNVLNAHEFTYFMKAGKIVEPEKKEGIINLVNPTYDLTSS